MTTEIEVGPASELPPGVVTGAGKYAVGNVDGERFAVTRKCRHLRADLAEGTINDDGCLECPWHHATYDPETGEMKRGPQGIFAKIPGLGAGFRLLTKFVPLGRGEVVQRKGSLYVR
jgi:nitrite reductase/ring-hydroxylating ferredoxin subunit